MKIENEFIPYQQALELKDLGFDEPCLRVCNPSGHAIWKFITISDDEDIDVKDILSQKFNDNWTEVPTFSQALNWIRDNHGLISSVWQIGVGVESGESIFEYMIDKLNKTSGPSEYEEHFPFASYEEAELACLKRLIEIVKENIL